jgi:hypothetical protein
LIIANVGDSLAFLDTGAEVLAISGNHRLEDSKSEVERIIASGGEVATSTVDGKPAGPIRVWPGGLAMSRSIGDVDAGDRVCAEPEVCQVTIPYEGARVIMGSDGLWDALHPKTAAHHVRSLPAEAAAHRLLQLAINKDHLKDDVTVVVVDFSPREEDKIPPVLSLSKKQKGHGSGSGSADKLAHVWHPLKDEGDHRVDYIATAHERRSQKLDAMKEAEAARVAEETLKAEKEAEIAAQRAVEAGKSLQGASGLYAELAHLTLTPEQIAAAFKVETAKKKAKEKETAEKKAKEAEQGWEDVTPSHHGGHKQQQQKQAQPQAQEQKQNAKGGKGGGKQAAKQQRPLAKAKATPVQVEAVSGGDTAGAKVLTVKKQPSKYARKPAAGTVTQPPLAAPAAGAKTAPALPPLQLVPTSVLLSTGPSLPPALATGDAAAAAAAAAKKKKARARRNKPKNTTDTNNTAS